MDHPSIDFLRQKPPFRYLDDVIAFDQQNRTIVTKMAPAQRSDRFWPDDLEGGYLWIEAMAQSCGLLLMATKKASRGYLISVEQLHFHRDPMDFTEGELHVRAIDYAPPYYVFNVHVRMETETVVQGQLKIFAE